MFAARLIAITWLLGSIYILFASRFWPGLFGTLTIALAVPAAIGILMRRRWAIGPAMLLCIAWGAVAVLIMIRGSGVSLHSVMLLVAAAACAAVFIVAHRDRGRSHVTFEYH